MLKSLVKIKYVLMSSFNWLKWKE